MSKDQKKLVPKLRFPGFAGEWKENTLGELFSEVNDRCGERSLELLSIKITGGVTKQSDSGKDDNSNKNKNKYKVVSVGDIAYNTMRMWQGASGVSKYEGIVSPAYTVVRIYEGVIDFYGYYFKFPRLVFDFYRYSQGLTSDTWNLKFRHFSEISVSVPLEFSEQQKIAEFLSSVDEWIENLEAQREKLTEYKKGMMQKIFSQEIRFKSENGNEFPKWKDRKLGQLFNEENERCGNKKLELLSVKITGGVTRQEKSGKDDNSNKDKSKYKVVSINDIAYNTMRMWQGASGVSQHNGIVSPAYTVVSLRKGDPNFFGYYFKFPRLVFNFYRYSQGLTSDTWNLKFRHFSEISLVVPEDPHEQERIAEFLSSIDELIMSKDKQIKKAKNWKKGLLQQMFV